MIKFFQNIRQKTLTENLPVGRTGKFGKYRTYTVGEIILPTKTLSYFLYL